MSKKSALDTIKLQSFDASDFLSWKIQVQLGMKEREIFYTVQSDFASTVEDVDEYQWNKDEDFCRDYLLNSLNPRLALTYHAYKTAKEIWDRLNAHFQKEEGLSKSLIGEKFFNFRFKANVSITTQLLELVNLRQKLDDDQSKMDDSLFVYMILSKLPPEWLFFKTEMHRLKEKISLDELKRFIHIEDQNIAGKSMEQVAQPSQAVNFVSRPSKPSRKPPAPKGDTHAPLAVKKPSLKRKKGKCHNCGKWGHWAAECKGPKRQKEEAPQNVANMVVDNSDPKSFVAMIGSSHRSASSEWWLDSGATCHVTNDMSLLSKVTTVKEKVENCNGGATDVTHAGTAELVLSSGKTLILQHVKVVPNLTKNLISMSLLDKAGMSFTTMNGRMTLSVNSHYFGCAYLINGMYRLSLDNDCINQVSSSLIDPKLLHNRLGHIHYKKMRDLAKSQNIPLDMSIRFDRCEVCAQTKITRNPFKTVSRSTQLLELIHSDLCDFRSHATRGGRKYLITFIDDFSRYCHVYLLKSKDETFETFKIFKSRVENQLNLKIKRFRSDRGGEYTATGFRDFCASEGIILETTAPYSPQSNGIAERKNRTLTEMLNSMLLTAGMPNSFWGEAVLTANHILNRVPHSKLNSTPYELWHGHPCRYDTLKTWGCIAYVRIQDLKRPKVGPRTTTCVYLGSAEDSAADRFLDLSTNSVIESRDAIFFEHKFIKDHGLTVSGSTDMISESTVEPEAGPSGTAPQPLEVEPVPLRVSTRDRIPKDFGENFVTYHLEDDPFSYQEAMRSRDALMWAEAIDDEMHSLLQNNTWHLVDLPKGAKVLGCKWVLKKKLHSDGSIARYKARLVAKGYKQQGGIDYFDVYSPVCHLSTIRILLALASIENFIVHQMDVKTAFLNGELDEEIYMAQPEGYVHKDLRDKVCKLINRSMVLNKHLKCGTLNLIKW
ncbi:hypothetical protein KSP39_PZI020937 [Platanthera zijinensis]|uniref:Polyprotein n=1 Tax=Platanthera zijinensis TaxID=2320716 RepID=A0AAP0FWF4_9ASPA